MNAVNAHMVPQLAAGCRLHPSQDLLLMPEGTLELSGPARDILARVDGTRSIAVLSEELAAQYGGAHPAEIEADVLHLLERLRQRGLIREKV